MLSCAIVPAPTLTPELAAFVQSGISILVGTRDAALRPACLRAVGCHVTSEQSLDLYFPDATASRSLANLRDNGQMAVTFSRAMDHRSIQLKGRCTSVRPSGERERAHQERYVAEFGQLLLVLGLPRFVVSRVAWWPSTAVTLAIESVFEQTPGPRAGLPLEGAAR